MWGGNFLRVWKNYHNLQLHQNKSKWLMAWFSNLLSTCISKMLTSKESLGAQDFYKSGQCDLSKVIPKQLMTKLRTDTALQSPSSELNRNPWKPHFSVLRVFQLKSGLHDAGTFFRNSRDISIWKKSWFKWHLWKIFKNYWQLILNIWKSNTLKSHDLVKRWHGKAEICTLSRNKKELEENIHSS